MTVNYRYIGKGTTDANGVAHITEDANGDPIDPAGYTGVGAGLTDIVASTDDPDEISSSSLQETYELWDTLFYDSGTTGTLGSDWWEYVNSGSVSADTTGILVDGTNGTEIIYANQSGTSASSLTDLRDYTLPYCVEFDIVSVEGTCFFQHMSGTIQNNEDLITVLGASNGCHVKTWIDSNKRYYKIDNNATIEKNNTEPSVTNYAIGFRTNQGGKIRFKNFKAYSI